MNLDPDAWTSASGYVQGAGRRQNGNNSGGSPFPAQVRFHVVHAFPPLPESKFKHIVTYKGSNQFEFMLSADQVEQIMTAFIAEQERGSSSRLGAAEEDKNGKRGGRVVRMWRVYCRFLGLTAANTGV